MSSVALAILALCVFVVAAFTALMLIVGLCATFIGWLREPRGTDLYRPSGNRLPYRAVLSDGLSPHTLEIALGIAAALFVAYLLIGWFCHRHRRRMARAATIRYLLRALAFAALSGHRLSPTTASARQPAAARARSSGERGMRGG